MRLTQSDRMETFSSKKKTHTQRERISEEYGCKNLANTEIVEICYDSTKLSRYTIKTIPFNIISPKKQFRKVTNSLGMFVRWIFVQFVQYSKITLNWGQSTKAQTHMHPDQFNNRLSNIVTMITESLKLCFNYYSL